MIFITELLAHRLRWFALLIGVVLFGFGGIWASSIPPGESTGGLIPAPRQGFLAPDFSVETADGGYSSIQDYRGSVVILNLWASWCPPCRAEMPALQSIHDTYQAKGVIVVGVNMTYQDNVSAAISFTEEYGITFPILLDRTGLVGNLYHMRALPTTFLIDRQGVIQEVVVGGPLSEITLQSMIQELLETES